jgi:hypothetical protein
LIPVGGKDLIVLTADNNALFAIRELLLQPQILGIRRVEFDCYAHPRRDAGVRIGAHEFLRPFLRSRQKALVVLDYEGCGREDISPQSLEAEMEQRLDANGWGLRSAAIVIKPELEEWLWDESLRVSRVLRWPTGATGLRVWLEERNLIRREDAKPRRPKEAFEAALRQLRRQRSSAIYRDLARNAEFAGCTDRSFLKFLSSLREWFPVHE